MKIFTVRDLDRHPGEVLNACDQEGAVRVRRRDGRSYRIEAEERAGAAPDWKSFVQERQNQLRHLFPKPLTRKQTRQVDKWIAGQ